jgi:hypothetical protein
MSGLGWASLLKGLAVHHLRLAHVPLQANLAIAVAQELHLLAQLLRQRLALGARWWREASSRAARS